MKRKKIKKKLRDEETFREQLENCIKNLIYISETDSEIFFFAGQKADEVSPEEILNQLDRKSSVEERNFYEFFDRLIQYQDWFGEEEKKTADRYRNLRNTLTENLIQKKIFKIGKIQIDIYIVGLDANNILKGVWTKAVET